MEAGISQQRVNICWPNFLIFLLLAANFFLISMALLHYIKQLTLKAYGFLYITLYTTLAIIELICKSSFNCESISIIN